MRISNEDFTFFESLINQAKHVVILAGEKPSVDTLAAALFIQENLEAIGKTVSTLAQGGMPSEMSEFTGRFQEKLPPKKLVVSFNWQKNAVDKVSYNMEGENFNFIITPQSKPIDVSDVKLTYSGLEPDLLINLTDQEPQRLQLDTEQIDDKNIINISNKDTKEIFGSLNFTYNQADSIAAIVGIVFEKGNLPVKTGSGQLLLRGIRSATDNFNNVADSTSFEAAAFCTKVDEVNKNENTKKTRSQDLFSSKPYKVEEPR